MKEIKNLLEKYLEIVTSEENKNNMKYWENADEPFFYERWRGRSLRKENVPFTIAMDISGYSKVLNINCKDYYTDPKEHLISQLRYAIWEFENLKCHRYFEKKVFIAFGSIFDASMFGAKAIYQSDQAPWFDEKNPILKEKENIHKIKPFDFYKSGLCKKAHEFYETIKEIISDYDIEVMFPLDIKGPFGVAVMLRGFNQLLLDIYDDPTFFKYLLGFITDYKKQFAKKRADFLGEMPPKCYLFNDEISTPTISNQIYEEFILPYELELSQLCSGARYWHSCGFTDKFYESINTIPNLRMMHIGPWSDIKKAVEVFSKKDIVLEICLNSIRDVYEKNTVETKDKLKSIKDMCEGKIRYSVRADGFAILNSIEFSLKKIREWNNIAREVFSGE